jgi:hypothetical protein
MRVRQTSGAAAALLAAMTPAAWAAPATRPAPDLSAALAATRDVWGEQAMREPDGPSYAFFEKLLPPLRYVNTQFRHYPIALAAPLGARKARLVGNGSGVNVSAGPNARAWHNFPLGVTVRVGGDDEVFGSDLARLHGPTYDRGYLPIVETRYRTGGATVVEEAFVPVDAPYGDHATVFVRLSLAGGASAVPVTLSVDAAGATTAQGAAWLDDNGRTLLLLGRGWTSDAAGKRVRATLGPAEPLVFAVSGAPLEAPPPPGDLDDATYQKLRATCAAEWERWVGRCLRLDVPEERVNRAWKATVIANLMMATGDQMAYSAGNVYQRLYEAESGDAVRALMLYGLTDTARGMTNPLLRYVQKGLGFHDAAFRLQLLAHVYWVTRDADFVRSRRDLWRPSVDHLLGSREKGTGLLPKENYCGDIHTQVYSLNSNANGWRGLRDIAAVLRDLGEAKEAARISTAADEFRAAILAALAKSERRDVTPAFIPIGLFGAEQPYERLTDTKMGSYWDLMIPYVLGSDFLDDARTDAALEYLHTRGGLCAGQVRFHQHSGLFANEDAVDDLYGLRYAQAVLRRDDVDRALVSFYGKLALGLTRDTFVGGEGTGLVPLDPGGRPMYLPPNSAGNGFFLTVLRELLVQDYDTDADGTPDTLRLLFATPRPWLADGKTLRIEAAPTAFGPVSLVAHSELSSGKVNVDLTPPSRLAKSVQLRLRLPDGWKVTRASAGGKELNVRADSTVDLPVRHDPFSVQFEVSR